MEISIAEIKDYSKITELYYKLYPDKVNEIKAFEGVSLKSQIFVAKNDNQIIGFILTTFVSYARSNAGYIEELFVCDDVRGRGIGSALVKKALEWQKNANSEVVFVTTDEAQEFYKRVGFRELGKNSWLCYSL